MREITGLNLLARLCTMEAWAQNYKHLDERFSLNTELTTMDYRAREVGYHIRYYHGTFTEPS